MNTLLIVDDSNKTIQELGDILSPHYHIRVANSVSSAMKVLSRFSDIDLIILDIIMPFDTGYDMIEILNNHEWYKNIPVIFISELDDILDEYRSFELGAVDYIKKPVVPSILLARVNYHLKNDIEKKKLENYILTLEDELKHSHCVDKKFNRVMLMTIANLIKLNISFAPNENTMMQQYMGVLIEQLINDNKFVKELNKNTTTNIILATPLYDIGKIALPPSLLIKDEIKYNLKDVYLMQNHTIIGADAIKKTATDLNLPTDANDYIQFAIEMAHYHHENWDGTGYPIGLSKYEIPLHARLVSILDVFDALTSKRLYRERHSFESAKQIIFDGKNIKFDPKIVDAFVKCFDTLTKIKKKYL